MFCMNWCGGLGGVGVGGGGGDDGKNNIITPPAATNTTNTTNTTKNNNGNNGDGRRSMFGTEKKYHFHEIYTLGDKLGQGNFAIVKQATRKNCDEQKQEQQQSYAIKIVDRKKLSAIDEEGLRDEIKIQKLLSSLNNNNNNNNNTTNNNTDASKSNSNSNESKESEQNNNIVQLYETFEEPSKYYLVLEMVNGGELFDRIVSKEYYSEREARDCLKVVLDGIRYCHENKVAHRDLKPENLLLKSRSNDIDIKIADFGFAKIVEEHNTLKTQCGTPAFVAPEILLGLKYDERCDNWSLGVIAYILLGGYPPFRENDIRKLFKLIMKGKYEYHNKYWSDVSDDAKNFISSLMERDVSKRVTSSNALRNKWICFNDNKTLSSRNLDLGQLRQFNAKRKFKSAVDSVIAINRLKNLAEYL